MSAHSPDQWTLMMLHAPIATALALSYKPVKKRPPASRVAVSLEARRLGDYFWWPSEALMSAIVAASWVLLLVRGDARVQWPTPTIFTYVFLGMLLMEMRLARKGFPLLADRPEEHQRWSLGFRRRWIRVAHIWRWYFAALLGVYALLHIRVVGAVSPWVYHVIEGTGFAFLAAITVMMIRVASWVVAGRKQGFCFAGGWSAPIARDRADLRRFIALLAVWLAGLALLMIFLR